MVRAWWRTRFAEDWGSLRRREDLMQLVSERFGTMIDVAPTKAVLTEDPVKEMEILTSMYLAPVEQGERLHQRTGRGGHCELDERGVHSAPACRS